MKTLIVFDLVPEDQELYALDEGEVMAFEDEARMQIHEIAGTVVNLMGQEERKVDAVILMQDKYLKESNQISHEDAAKTPFKQVVCFSFLL